jgi:hypothetical protein
LIRSIGSSGRCQGARFSLLFLAISLSILWALTQHFLTSGLSRSEIWRREKERQEQVTQTVSVAGQDGSAYSITVREADRSHGSAHTADRWTQEAAVN